ncbi:Golgi phosphoprotein 3-domain-containing protein [Chytriomyces cf. hyalinus JEL632]|nr:Golgi phosphoprotein 3-domain-containing protein [Chytriomyces cf. hyalinus JEL632]
MMSGLTQRKRNVASDVLDEHDDNYNNNNLSSNNNGGGAGSSTAVDRDRDEKDDDGDDKQGKRANKLTLMEEILLMGLKDSQGHLSFWNDNISYVLRGCILMELSFRKRISTVSEVRKRPFSERLLQVIDDRSTGEVLLDEALRMIKTDSQSIASWIDLMSGETWNLMSFNYQLKQVRERIAKGLVDKGVLRTEKRNFILFDMATHPVADYSVKEQLVQKTVDCLLGRGSAPSKQLVAMCCAAYAANVLENALVGLNHVQREQAFTKVDEMLQAWASMGEKAKAGGCDDVMAGVLSVYTKMDSLL